MVLTLPAETDAFLAAHDGVARRHELGVPDRQLQTLTSAGLLKRVGRSVYVGPRHGTARTPARVSVARSDTAVVSHVTAAWLWGADGFDRRDVGVPEAMKRPHVTVRTRDRRVPWAATHQCDDLEACDVACLDGIWLTDVTRTLCDLGAVAKPARVERAVEWALRNDHVLRAQLHARLDALQRQGRRGPDVLERVIGRRGGLAVPPTESDAETMFVIVARHPERPDPDRQRVVDERDHRFRVDFAYEWPELPRPVWVEIDGLSTHSGSHALTRDLYRQNVLMRHDAVLLRFTSTDVYERARYVRQETWRHLGLRRPERPERRPERR